ncbi:MAG: pseudouridine synthase [Gammaproteobacteria bacterium]|nr:pseudouridine synthase [Gammaproteobacteria bacterium]
MNKQPLSEKIVILFNKPFNVLTQFTDASKRQTLADFVSYKNVYPAGRLDRDSEGLIVLTNDGKLQHQISDPRHKIEKTYWVQVEGAPDQKALTQLQKGLHLKDGLTAPAKARIIDEPSIWPRTPPIRKRANIPTTWLELIIREGRNRQVRRMTAAAGHPTLRLIRYAIGSWTIEGLQPGEWKKTKKVQANAPRSKICR